MFPFTCTFGVTNEFCLLACVGRKREEYLNELCVNQWNNYVPLIIFTEMLGGKIGTFLKANFAEKNLD